MESSPNLQITLGLKFWLKSDDKSIVGPGDITLIQALHQSKNLTKAAEACGYSYKYAWKKLQDLKKKTGQDVVIAQKGGKGGGGHVEVTAWGEYLIQIYQKVQTRAVNFIVQMNQEIENMNKKG